MDLRAYLTVLRRNWPLLVAPVVIGLIIAVAALAAQTPKYQSTAKVIVSVGNTANANDLSQANSFAQSAAANFAALAEQPYVLHAVRQQLKLTLSSDEIAEEMSTSVEQGTSIIAIDVLDASGTRAAAIANATATQLSTAVSVLNPAASDGTQTVRVTVVRTAGVAPDPIVPDRALGLALGLLGGLLLGLVLVILRELLDTRVRSVEELQQLLGAPVVGQIPRTPAIAGRPLTMIEEPGGSAAEAFRLLQLNLEYLRAPNGVVVVGVTSAVPSEGKSTVAANLALALAAAGQRVVLLDADLRRPTLHDLFGTVDGIGLTDVLVGRVDVLDAVQPWGDQGLTLVPAGRTPPNPGELLQSPRLRAALDRLAETADVVVVDGPPLLAVADSAVLARSVDAVLVVSSMQSGHRGAIARSTGVLESVGARVLGGVATMTRPARVDAEAYQRYADGSSTDAVAQPFRDAPEPEAARTPIRSSAPADASPEAPSPDGGGEVAEAPAAAPASRTRQRRAPRAPAAPVPADGPDPVLPADAEEAEIPDGAAQAVSGSSSRVEATAEQPVGSDQDAVRPARTAARPVRVPSVRDIDAKTMRTLRRRMSAEDLRILRGFTARRDEDAG